MDCDISGEDYKDLKAYLSEQPQVEKVENRYRAQDSAPDPNVMYFVVQTFHCIVHLAKLAEPYAKDAGQIVLGAMVKSWIDKRNERKKKEIEQGTTTLLLYDASGHEIKVKKQ
jgi:hypothetical protein